MRRLTTLTAGLIALAMFSAVSAADAQDAATGEKFSDRMSAEVIDKAITGVVKLRTLAAPSARSNATLGAEREGNGVLLSPRLVLTIAYLIMEADEVEITDHKGRKLPGKVAGFDQETGLGLVRLLAPAQGEPFMLGDAGALKEKDAVLAAGARGIVIAGTGNGTVHRELLQAAQRARAAGVAVVRASRCLGGGVFGATPDALPSHGGVTPWQARIELLLDLMRAPQP